LKLPHRLVKSLKQAIAQREEELSAVHSRNEESAKNWGTSSVSWKLGNARKMPVLKPERSRRERYSSALPASLQTEIEAFTDFLTAWSAPGRRDPRIRPVSAAMYASHVRRLAGWLLAENPNITLSSLVPSPDKDGIEPVARYMKWLQHSRGVGLLYADRAVTSWVRLAKFLYREQLGELERPDDLGILRALRALQSQVRSSWPVTASATESDLKWIDWPDYLNCIQRLEKEFVETRNSFTPKDFESPKKVFSACRLLQVLLLASFFACVPDRQRTMRELELGRTFVRKGAMWAIKHEADDYKTGKTYGERPLLHIDPRLNPLIDEYLAKWRPLLKPDNNFFFCDGNGKPVTRQYLHYLFSTHMYRLTGKRTNPHLIRDMVVTHARNSDASEKQLDALALFMGHSTREQKKTYDRRTREQKVAPAVELLNFLKNN